MERLALSSRLLIMRSKLCVVIFFSFVLFANALDIFMQIPQNEPQTGARSRRFSYVCTTGASFNSQRVGTAAGIAVRDDGFEYMDFVVVLSQGSNNGAVCFSGIVPDLNTSSPAVEVGVLGCGGDFSSGSSLGTLRDMGTGTVAGVVYRRIRLSFNTAELSNPNLVPANAVPASLRYLEFYFVGSNDSNVDPKAAFLQNDLDDETNYYPVYDVFFVDGSGDSSGRGFGVVPSNVDVNGSYPNLALPDFAIKLSSRGFTGTLCFRGLENLTSSSFQLGVFGCGGDFKYGTGVADITYTCNNPAAKKVRVPLVPLRNGGYYVGPLRPIISTTQLVFRAFLSRPPLGKFFNTTFPFEGAIEAQGVTDRARAVGFYQSFYKQGQTESDNPLMLVWTARLPGLGDICFQELDLTSNPLPRTRDSGAFGCGGRYVGGSGKARLVTIQPSITINNDDVVDYVEVRVPLQLYSASPQTYVVGGLLPGQ